RANVGEQAAGKAPIVNLADRVIIQKCRWCRHSGMLAGAAGRRKPPAEWRSEAGWRMRSGADRNPAAWWSRRGPRARLCPATKAGGTAVAPRALATPSIHHSEGSMGIIAWIVLGLLAGAIAK